MIANEPLVSVIMSVFNEQKNVRESILSILNQSYSNFEFLIMDDGSTDETYKAINSIKDKRIKLFKNTKNIGLTKSLNLLIKESKGELIARQDSDDISHFNRFQFEVNKILKLNIDAITTRAYINGSNKVIPGISYFLPNKIVIKFKNPFIHGTLMIRKETLINLGLYDENYIYAQDYKLFADIIRNNIKIYTSKKPYYILNTENNISSLKKAEQNKYADLVKSTINLK